VTFSNPVFLRLGVGLALLVVLGLWSHDRRRRRLAEFLGGQPAVRRLSGSNLYRLRLERIFLLGLGALALALAAADPRWEAPAIEPQASPRSVVIAIDISASMQATDIAPTRLGQAVGIAGDVIKVLERDRIGLLLFAGNSYVLAPPTHDHKALAYLLRGVTPTIASLDDPGTLVSVAIQESAGLLNGADEPQGQREIIVISDGESGEPEAVVRAAARAAVAKGIRIHTIGVGTSRGATMVMPDGPYRKGGPVVDRAGAPVISRFREPVLRGLAQVGGGRFAHGGGQARLGEIERMVETPDQQPGSQDASRAPLWARIDLTFWLVLGALVCVLLESLLDFRLPETLVAARRIA
jgi:Ca-activated chloride channel family protein